MSVRYRSKAKNAIGRIEGGTERNVRAAATHFTTEIRKLLIRGVRTGRDYRVPGGTRRTYTASAPGEPPAPRTGRLANSYTEARQTRYRYLVGSPLFYAPLLEKGTSKMRPRPHFKVTFNAEQRTLRQILSRPVL